MKWLIMLAILITLFLTLAFIGGFAAYRDVERFTAEEAWSRTPASAPASGIAWTDVDTFLREIELGRPASLKLSADDVLKLLTEHPAHPVTRMRISLPGGLLLMETSFPLGDVPFFRDRHLHGLFSLEPVRDGERWRVGVVGIKVDGEELGEAHLDLFAPRAEMQFNKALAQDAWLNRVTTETPYIHIGETHLVLTSEPPPEPTEAEPSESDEGL